MGGQDCDDCLGDGSRDSKKHIFNKITEHAALLGWETLQRVFYNLKKLIVKIRFISQNHSKELLYSGIQCSSLIYFQTGDSYQYNRSENFHIIFSLIFDC